jgi:hypothetical protein
MRLRSKLAVLAGTMALGAFPAVALGHPGGHPNQSSSPTHPSNVANGSITNPAKACANESKKHVAGQRGTPYSVCVSGAKKMQKQPAGG